MQLDSETEWGHFIDPETFQIIEIVEDIPDGCFAVIKERQYIEDIGREIIQTTYGLVDGNKFQPYKKREISVLISKACADFILKENKFPPKVNVKDKLMEDKPAKLTFVMNQYDTFHLQLDKNLLRGANPIEILNPILEESSSSEDDEGKWKVEYAKSSRATCKKCRMKIEKDTVRVGEPSFFQDHLSYKWHHERCVYWKRLSRFNVTGLDTLEDDDKYRIEKLLA